MTIQLLPNPELGRRRSLPEGGVWGGVGVGSDGMRGSSSAICGRYKYPSR